MHYVGEVFKAIEAIPGELFNSLLMAKLISDCKTCSQLLHAESYKQLIEIRKKNKIAQIQNYTPTPSHLAINKALEDIYTLIDLSLRDPKYTQPEVREVYLSFQQALLCLITARLGNITPVITLKNIDDNNVYEFATDSGWLTIPPGTDGEKVNILQAMMIEITKYHHAFIQMTPGTDNKIFSSFIASTNFVKGVSDAFSPEIDLKFSQRIALGMLAFLSKKDVKVLLPIIQELNTLDDSEAILNFICCCLSTKYLDNFKKNKDSSINNKILLSLACMFIIFSAIVTSAVYMTSNTAISTLLLYFSVLSITSILTAYLSIRFIIGIDLNDYRRSVQIPTPSSIIAPTTRTPTTAHDAYHTPRGRNRHINRTFRIET